MTNLQSEELYSRLENLERRTFEETDFRKSLENLINRHSKENGSNTPDFLLADYLIDCLAAYDKAVRRREKWYGREANLCGEFPLTSVDKKCNLGTDANVPTVT